MKFLQSAFFIGYVISHVPGGIMADIYGGKQVVGFGLLLSAICTLLTPPAARLGVWWLFALRIAMGIFQGPTYPSLNNMMSHWAPIGERGRIGAMIFAGAQLGNTVNFLGTGFLISTFRAWETPFYVFGVIGIIWFLLWQVLCYNDPMTHPFISEQEKRFLMASSVGQLKKRADLPRTPILKMMMSIPLWALILAQIGHDWGIFTLLTVMPIYFKSVLHFSLKQNAVLSAAPNLLMWCAAIISGYLVDCMINNGLGITFVRKLFVTIASFGPCLGMLLVGYAGCDKVGVSIPFIIGMGTMGAFVPSLKVNALDLSPNYAGTTLAFVNGIGSLAGIASPALVAILTPNSTLAEWRIVFWVVFGIMNVTNLVYILFGSAEVQKWDEG
ncbi:sialin [Nilaparvata lugens]|uniref:sialin n=1 Tax=Nilaparvata lugens TaxID=108931 RepID=UPI00193D90EA|nr:sialin [Nilaparvata lugens]